MAMNGWAAVTAARTMEVERTMKSEAIFAFIVRHKLEHDGVAPTVREILGAVGISSTSVVCYHLALLEEAGRIRRMEGEPRAIVVVGGQWVAPAGVEPT